MGRGLKIRLMEYINNNNILHYSVEQEFWKKVESGKAKEVRLPLSNAWLSAFCGSPWCRRGDCGNCSASAQWACTDNNNVKYICFHCVGKSETITLKIEKISISYEMVGCGTISKCFIVSFSERTGALVELTVQEQRWNTFTRYIIFSRRGSIIFEKHNNILPWGGYTYIYGLWVVEEYRKTGIAGQLLDKAEEIARSLGCEDVCLEWENTTPKWVFDWYIKKGYEELELSCSGSLLIKRFDIPQEQMTKLVKMQLQDMAAWSFKSYTVTGTTGSEYCITDSSKPLSIVYPNDENIAIARAKIEAVEQGKDPDLITSVPTTNAQ